MSRPDPIQYADRLYAAIRAANFSPISFLAFGNAVKEGIELRRMPRIAAEPFMRVVGEMLDLEETADEGIIDAAVDRVDPREAAQPLAAHDTSAVEPLAGAGAMTPETSTATQSPVQSVERHRNSSER